VLADSTQAWASPWLAAPGATAECRLDVTGAALLSLCVESSFSAGGRAVWVDPRLLHLPLHQHAPALLQLSQQVRAGERSQCQGTNQLLNILDFMSGSL
jgi:hypothetical protein